MIRGEWTTGGMRLAASGGVSESLSQQWKVFKNDRPGRRFLKRHEKMDAAGARGKRIAILVLGVVVMLVGIVLMPAPGPGMPVVAVGAAMVAQSSRMVAKVADRLEVLGRSAVKNATQAWKTAPVSLKCACAIGAVAVLAGLTILTYRLTFGT
jgi:hypothetical protein